MRCLTPGLLVDDQQRVLLLTKPSTRYPHGIAEDQLEATEITLLETVPSLRVVISIAISGQRVVEGVSPIWADLNGDGQREIIVTQSDAEQGRRWSSIPSLENNWQRARPWARQSLAASVCCNAFWQ